MAPAFSTERRETPSEYDAVIVGGSLAGSAAAALMARLGARVALVEKRPDPGAFKRVCSHHIQASAVPTIERLGVMPAIEAAGGVRCRARLRTRWGWIVPPAGGRVQRSLNLRRERLDPIVRRRAAETPGVHLLAGRAVDSLLFEDGRVSGVEVAGRHGRRERLTTRLVVGADGRDSRVARLAKVRVRTSPHNRFAYAAAYEGPGPDGAPDATLWLLDPHMAAAFPTDSGLTLYACMPTKDRLPEFKRDPESALRAFVAALPDPPPILASSRVSPVIGKIDMTNLRRGPTAPGLALIGDAALATDPLWGVGCGWAFQSAEWLADALAPALRGEEPLARGLRRYARRHRRQLLGHSLLIHDYADGRPMNAVERLMFSAAVRDKRLAEHSEAFGTRTVGPARYLAPRHVGRAVAVNSRHLLGSVRGARNRPPAPCGESDLERSPATVD